MKNIYRIYLLRHPRLLVPLLFLSHEIYLWEKSGVIVGECLYKLKQNKTATKPKQVIWLGCSSANTCVRSMHRIPGFDPQDKYTECDGVCLQSQQHTRSAGEKIRSSKSSWVP